MAKKKSDPAHTDAELLWKRESAWPKIGTTERRRIDTYCAEYLSFLSEAKTEREAYDIALNLAGAAGYLDLDKPAAAALQPGARLFRGRGGKVMMLAVLGRRPLTEGLRIVGAHTDAPRLDAKPCPIYEDSALALVDTHYYGGIKKYQWVTLPLAIHGTVIKEDGEAVSICIGEAADDPVFVITDLLPHLGKEQAKKSLSEGIEGENLNVLAASVPAAAGADGRDVKEPVKLNLLRLLRERYGICEQDLASAELEIVPAGPARELGFDRSMLLGYAQDDRVCAYAGLRALLDVDETPEHTCVLLLCDKEEIGSKGATGMDSTFFENSVAELIAATEGEAGADLTLRRCLEHSRMLSADVSVLHDPNFPDVSSPNNMAMMNAGVVIGKYGGARGKSGASEASAEFMAELRRSFNSHAVIWQTGELGKVDLGGGGTIAMFLARYGMDVVDCGVGLLSMHSPWEVAGKLDTYMAYKAYHTFFRNPGTTG